MRRFIANGRDDLFVKKVAKTSLAAWEPFWEVLSIYFSFNHQEIDDEHPEWRMMWLSQVTLLRVIGHVLAKVDVEKSVVHKVTINAKWAEWKAQRAHNWVFWNFIEDERNNLLKAYRFGVEVDEHGLFHDTLDMDGHQLLREAIYWWRDQLEEIENDLSVKVPPSGKEGIEIAVISIKYFYQTPATDEALVRFLSRAFTCPAQG